ncbi:hypothetical protein Tco_1472986, partial [Tanacetum coccineum]
KVMEQVKKEVPAQVRDQVPVYLAKGLILERKTTKEETERFISKAILQAHISSQIQNAIDNAIPSLVDASVRSYMSGHILYVHPAQVQSSSVPEQQHQLYLAMKTDPLLQQQDIAIWLALQMKFEKTHVPQTACRSSAVRTRDHDDPHDDAHPEGENSAKRQKTSKYEAYVSGESSSGLVNVEEPGPSTSGLLWSLSVFIRSSVIWERVHDFQLGIESYQQKINLTAPTITFPGIKEYDVFSIFCDATLRRTLEGLKSYYNDVKYGYVQKELTNDEVEFLKLFEEEIEVRLNYRDQMRRWEMYVNGRPLGPKRDRPE